ncbi:MULTISPECIES: sugar ABC transporter ATP-binding protein [unclassified Rhizobium]|uniref:sugar ABC transporter ATP-binding protein n=1 Tax=unclassified Rhizobium TaxID=2613769 RepID=UPI00161B8303|nr:MULTISPECIES: sugar ABC transporter ATP-binding protein [unclassified Rhizobium]MBB3290149.1 simple sugar transport system ATP-binding protein [Rhizobium sp. BK252]MBB3404963.1 simple sugar transport system ATP-binding protein [Rhizobium sp. BK289]MBB3417509.1 simple sugar transport system ATP-binding protein [Rhizobium sp. BK284]MBB3485219.1 simple sugar transport system ATP-binding protein [Rhizobium sp. BK347]
MTLLDIQNLSLAFGSTQALAGASLTIDSGEVVALMGANGAGKSTLVKILSGIHRADSGRILWNGNDYHADSPAGAVAQGIVTVHQSTDVVGVAGLSMADALLLNQFVDGRQPFFLSKRTVRRKAATILSEAGFDLPLDRDFGDLGTADRQMVAIARALSNKAQLLILDEPTASLSARETGRLYDIVRQLKARGLGILYISHRTADLDALADRVVVLRGGRNVGDFTRPIDFNAAIETMIGRSMTAARPHRRERFDQTVLELQGVRLLAGSPPIDLKLHAGEVVAITGVLGAGKSRLLSALFGLERFAAGNALLDGAPFEPASPAEAIARGVVMAAADRHRSSLMPLDWPGESIASTISLPHLKQWYPSGFLFSGRETREGEKAIRRLGIKASGPDASVWSLSGGNQQKVVLARWEAEPSRLLLLDEPFQGVDVGARQDIIAAIRAHSDRATLIATSDPEEALEVADRVVLMEHHTLKEVAHASDGDRQNEEYA